MRRGHVVERVARRRRHRAAVHRQRRHLIARRGRDGKGLIGSVGRRRRARRNRAIRIRIVDRNRRRYQRHS